MKGTNIVYIVAILFHLRFSGARVATQNETYIWSFFMDKKTNEKLQVVQLQEYWHYYSAWKAREDSQWVSLRTSDQAQCISRDLFFIYQMRCLDSNDSRNSSWTWSRLVRIFASESVWLFCFALSAPGPDAWHHGN